MNNFIEIESEERLLDNYLIIYLYTHIVILPVLLHWNVNSQYPCSICNERIADFAQSIINRYFIKVTITLRLIS